MAHLIGIFKLYFWCIVCFDTAFSSPLRAHCWTLVPRSRSSMAGERVGPPLISPLHALQPSTNMSRSGSRCIRYLMLLQTLAALWDKICCVVVNIDGKIAKVTSMVVSR